MDIFKQLSYEDVNQKILSYGNYVLDDISTSFKKPDIDEIRVDHYDGFAIIRVEFKDLPKAWQKLSVIHHHVYEAKSSGQPNGCWIVYL